MFKRARKKGICKAFCSDGLAGPSENSGGRGRSTGWTEQAVGKGNFSRTGVSRDPRCRTQPSFPVPPQCSPSRSLCLDSVLRTSSACCRDSCHCTSSWMCDLHTVKDSCVRDFLKVWKSGGENSEWSIYLKGLDSQRKVRMFNLISDSF